MITMALFKLLDQLSVKELRKELRNRYLLSAGTKEVLTARLRHALVDEEEDPDAYLFEIEPDIYELIGKMHEGVGALCDKINRMGNKVDEMVSQVEGQIDQIDQIESQVKGGINLLMKEQLPVDSLGKKLHGQDCGCTNSGDGDSGDLSAVCVCVVGKSCGCDFKDEEGDNDCCDDLERKERNEETDVCYVPDAFVPVAPVTSTCMSRTDQDNVWSASKPIAVDLKDLCLSAGAHEENVRLDNCIQNLSMNCKCGALHGECGCQENHQEDMCTSAIIIDIGINECQSTHTTSELSRGRHLPIQREEAYLLDVRLLVEDDCGALNLVCNVAEVEPAVPTRDVCRQGLLKRRARSTAVLRKTVLDTISLSVKRPRHRLNNSLVNWRKRKRRLRKTVQIDSWATGTLPPVAPTDRPPPELSNLSCSVFLFGTKSVKTGAMLRPRHAHLKSG